MYASARHNALTYAMYPASTPQVTTTATQLDKQHRATLARPAAHRLRRALATAVTARRDPIA